MSEFDKLKDDAEQVEQQHPQQVHEGEQDAEKAAEKEFGGGGGQSQGGQQDQGGQSQSGQDQGAGDQQQGN
jgi:hypothetical protein